MTRVLLLLTLVACSEAERTEPSGPHVIVLGIAQDAGYPQAGCKKPCCAPAWNDASRRRHTASLAIVDPDTNERWLIECTPDVKDQLRALGGDRVDGVLLTHAHIGHYAGLVHFGREVMGANGVPAYVMPRMKTFLTKNGPWSLLVKLNNIELRPLAEGKPLALNSRLRVTPLTVPHRDEFSETVCFLIEGPRRSILWLPDIDKWERWQTPIEDVLARVDVAYVDGTFYADGELPGRDMAKIPHPFIAESIARFAKLPAATRKKIRFIHLNHTNPALDPGSKAAARIHAAGHAVAKQGEREDL